jgi:hypothetical protein
MPMAGKFCKELNKSLLVVEGLSTVPASFKYI